MAWLATIQLALVLAVTACTAPPSTSADRVPADAQAAAREVADRARGVDGITGTELRVSPPREASRNGILTTRRGIWEVTLKVQLASGTANAQAVTAAQQVAATIGTYADDYSWVVLMEDGQMEADAVIYQSRPSEHAQAANFSKTAYITDARKYRTIPGVLEVSIDGSGTVTTTVDSFAELGDIAASLLRHHARALVIAAPQGKARFMMNGSWLGKDFLGLLTVLGTTHPVNDINVGESAVDSERILKIKVPTKDDATAVEKVLEESTLVFDEGQTVVRDYVISYGEPETGPDGKQTWPFLSGQLRYSPEPPKENTAPKNPEPAPAFTPPAYTASPACTPEQVSVDVPGRIEAALGHRSMTVVLSNISETSCSVDGYPAVKFQEPDGGNLPVTLVNGPSYMFADPGPTPVSLAPGGTAWAMLHWRANSTSQGFILPAYLEVAPEEDGAFAARFQLVDIPDIEDGTEIKVSAWSWPDAAAFR